MYVFERKEEKSKKRRGKDKRKEANLVLTADPNEVNGFFLFFLRNSDKPIKIKTRFSEELVAGTLTTEGMPLFHTTLQNVFSPLMSQMKLGKLSDEKQSALVSMTTDFQDNLGDTIATLTGEIELRAPSSLLGIEQTPIGFEKAAADASIVKQCQDLLGKWAVDVKAYIEKDESDKLLDPRDQSGPEVEIGYWAARMTTFVNIAETLSGATGRIVLGVLKQAAAPVKAPKDDEGKERVQASKDVLAKWRDVDMGLTHALNEAKDSSRFLSKLGKILRPSYSATLPTIKKEIPTIVNNLKMIYTLSRHYGTRVRMTNLFSRITNFLVARCKKIIYAGPDASSVWQRQASDVVKDLRDAIALREEYTRCYREASSDSFDSKQQKTEKNVKAAAEGSRFKGRFNFNSKRIFDSFEQFARRAEKLLDMFSAVEQYKLFTDFHVDKTEGIVKRFDAVIRDFRLREHDLLDYTNSAFERDFVQFNMLNSRIETEVQDLISAEINSRAPIMKKIRIVELFDKVLRQESLRRDLEDKYLNLFQIYGKMLSNKNGNDIKTLFAKYSSTPPIARNFPKVAGSIHWARQLYRIIEDPMMAFKLSPHAEKIFARREGGGGRESKRTIRVHNELSQQLLSFESKYYDEWRKEAAGAKKKLYTPLILQHKKKILVNFETKIIRHIKEARHLKYMGKEIPTSMRTVLLLRRQLQRAIVSVTKIVQRYNEAVSMADGPITTLFKSHIRSLKKVVSAGKNRLRWTSMNIGFFIERVNKALGEFENLKQLVVDIIKNRIDTNLAFVRSVLLIKIVPGQTYKVSDLANEQKKYAAKCCAVLVEKNLELERAVNDVARKITTDAKIRQIPAPSAIEVNKLRAAYSNMFYDAVLGSVQKSLSYFTTRLESKDPLFEVNLKLQAPNIVLSPTVENVQKGINDVKNCILSPAEKLMDWGVTPEGKVSPRRSLGPAVSLACATKMSEVEAFMAKHNESVEGNLAPFLALNWLWEGDPAAEYQQFAKQPGLILEDFTNKLRSFVDKEATIKAQMDATNHGPLLLLTAQLKKDLIGQVVEWKLAFSKELHKEASAELEDLGMELKDLREGLNIEIKDIMTLNDVMSAQTNIRVAQSNMELKFVRVFEKLGVLSKYIKLDKKEVGAEKVLRKLWNSTLEQSEKVFQHIQTIKGPYKKTLISKVKEFQRTVADFDQDYKENGPMVDGIDPKEATGRLKRFQREFVGQWRKMKLYGEGEKLFGLPAKTYPSLIKTDGQLKLLSKLYGLYNDVLNTIADYNDLLWTDVVTNINEMEITVADFNKRCKSMPKTLRGWPAYGDLKKKLEDFDELLPLLMALAEPAMRQRHWTAVSELTKTEFDMTTFGDMKLEKVMGALFQSMEVKDDIADICDAAVKELKVEKTLSLEEKKWEEFEFEFAPWKARGDVIFKGDRMNDIQTELEESQGSASGLLANKYIKPFRVRAEKFAQKLTRVNETLERWLKVQVMWRSLEAVFTAGDIMRALPKDTRVFQKVDKEWCSRLMEKAKETKNVTACCEDEYVVAVLKDMRRDLDECQKSLTGYLEKKRSKFPRFYFVSDSALLDILSQGSDKKAVQSCFEKVFAGINRVEFNGNNITTIMNVKRGEAEKVPLPKPVPAKGNIEDWLNVLLGEMSVAVKGIVRTGATTYDAMPVEEFINRSAGQIALLGIQFMWTSDVQDGLTRLRKFPKALREADQKQKGILETLTAMVTQNIKKKMDRVKIETMVTIQVHQKEVLEDIVEMTEVKGEGRVTNANDFMWQRQLRCYWDVEEDDCIVQVANVKFSYCNEYLGCVGRLCVTPLTDRCYISLTQAMGMAYGGAPAGPAGTGKTETVKDLARGLGKWCVVFNCSDQMHTADTAKLYKGLCQSGSWGCFDEFNRIELEVLSVVAQQVEAIMNALRERRPKFQFPGTDGDVTVDPRLGFFITMNPGYAGRQELPENLKALFRTVAMMVPDSEIIIRVLLAAQGYTTFTQLSKKFRILYGLCEEQLSAQRHYDFGLRNIISVLRTGGTNLREALKEKVSDRNNLEEMLMMRTIRDMNLAKLVADDVGLFISLLADLFPKQKSPATKEWVDHEKNMEEICEEWGLMYHPSWKTKAIQLYETSLVRHGLMMVGPAGGGKTMATRVLLEAMTRIAGNTGGIKCDEVRMCPKAMRAPEMFGENDLLSGEWTDGVFSAIWFEANKPTTTKRTWIVCDGPVDTLWIENLNSVLDDNRLLTLANGDRVPMHQNCRILFEPRDLRNASPATVSRTGIVYVSSNDLGWEPVVAAWLMSHAKEDEDEAKAVRALTDKYLVQKNLVWVRRNTQYKMDVMDVHMITNLLALLKALLKLRGEEDEYTEETFERLFLYAFTWSFGALLESDDRKKLDTWLRKTASKGAMPEGKDTTVYDFYLQQDAGADDYSQWVRWTAPEWKFPGESFTFSSCLIPTVETSRAFFLFDLMSRNSDKPCLVIGSPGTAKTSIVEQYCRRLKNEDNKLIVKKSNFSFATVPGMFQEQMEADLEKKSNQTFHPRDGRPMIVFLDDLSMPEINEWGDQPTLEIVRQVLEQGGFYFLDKDLRGRMMNITKIKYIGAMTHPGGGRNDIPSRCKRHFYCFNVTPPDMLTVNTIFGSMVRENYKYQDLKEMADMVPKLTQATIDLWTQCKNSLLPTPSKFHYIFNLRDISRIFGGMLQSPSMDREEKAVTQTVDQLVTLWRHESERVLSDKLADLKDKKFFNATMLKVTKQYFGDEYYNKFRELKRPPYFATFMRDDKIDPETDEIAELGERVYEMVPSEYDIRARCEFFLAQYNDPHKDGPGPTGKQYRARMDLVLFNDAMEHMMRISRIIGTPKGSALLAGVGGSGRQSLTRLAAFVQRQEVYQIEVVKNYKVDKFKEDIKELYMKVGKEGRTFTWIFPDYDIIKEDFLEYLNMILSTGVIPGLFTRDERDAMSADLRDAAKEQFGAAFDDTPDNINKFFYDRIRDNLHIVLAFSPANPKFAERARKFPALINCCNIDWFLPWPVDALQDVSNKFICGEQKDFRLEGDEGVDEKVALYIAKVHHIINRSCADYYNRFRRRVFVTPNSYLSFIRFYKAKYMEKLREISKKESDVTLGLEKLAEAEKSVGELKKELAVKGAEVAQATRETEEVLRRVNEGQKKADQKMEAAAKVERAASKVANAIEKEKIAANKLLAKAMPFVVAAEEAASKVKPEDIRNIMALANPPEIIQRIMDCIDILFYSPMTEKIDATADAKTYGFEGAPMYVKFVTPSWSFSKKLMQSGSFCKDIINFATTERKDMINEETMELLEPYYLFPGFIPQFAKKASDAAEGLLMFVRAMYQYHNAALIAKPLQKALEIKQAELDIATKKLDAATRSCNQAKALVAELQAKLDEASAKKKKLTDTYEGLMTKRDEATKLLASLADEKIRWGDSQKLFASDKRKLLGDMAMACAFVSYCGPFNFQYRQKLMTQDLYEEVKSLGIPVNAKVDVTELLVDEATISQWNNESLPKDELSVQNGILVVEASPKRDPKTRKATDPLLVRFPMLIDPQGQALVWLKNREEDNFPYQGTTTLGHRKLSEITRVCVENGKTLLVEGVVDGLTSLFDPILQKRIKKGRGRNKWTIKIDGEELEYSLDFKMFCLTKVANPSFSPELSAQTTVIDFSVTREGLEQQLLSYVIQNEQPQLEVKRKQLIEAVNSATINLQNLDKVLLDKLANSKGNLLDDVELIRVLRKTKQNAKEVKEQIQASTRTQKTISEKREFYRPVATRGSIVYFTIVDTTTLNPMYQTSLNQFLVWFFYTLNNSDEPQDAKKRCDILIDRVTYNSYVALDRGLFVQDKLIFKLLLTLKIIEVEKAELINQSMFDFLFKAGMTLTPSDCPNHKFGWIDGGSKGTVWANVVQLSKTQAFYNDLLNKIRQNEKEWKEWFNSLNPEELPIPSFEERLLSDPAGPLLRLLLIRAFRDDRVCRAADIFFGKILGKTYMKPLVTSVTKTYDAVGAGKWTPSILLLTPGADPTGQIKALAKVQNANVDKYTVSMGEGQEKYAKLAIDTAMVEGGWVLLNNCHLGLAYMNSLTDYLEQKKEEDAATRVAMEQKRAPEEEKKSGKKGKKKKEKPFLCHDNFRLWITCEAHPEFPIALLQAAIKMTMEPPKGIKAGLLRSYTEVVDEERLGRVPEQSWRDLVFSLCFLHSVVQERRKFGPIGWCIPYEFNQSDLEASLLFLEKHFYETGRAGVSWNTIQYMICEVQYGGRITDDFDRVLLNAFGLVWLSPQAFRDDFRFCAPQATAEGKFEYKIPKSESIDVFLDYIDEVPDNDVPSLFGLHSNADLTLGKTSTASMLEAIQSTRPRDGGSSGGKSQNEIVTEQAAALLARVPVMPSVDEVRSKIVKRPKKQEIMWTLGKATFEALERVNEEEKKTLTGIDIPLNVFLLQELERMRKIVKCVKETLRDVGYAIAGEIIMTPQLADAINAIFDGRPPRHWYIDTAGNEVAWTTPALSAWFEGLERRFEQLYKWLTVMRPTVYWMTGFFNPQGFLTSMRQEVTRRHKLENWALDEVQLFTTILDVTNPDKMKKPKGVEIPEGVYVSGLYLEGATWDSNKKALELPRAGELYVEMPVVHITAMLNQKAKEKYSKGIWYDCPVYTKKRRTDVNYVYTPRVRIPNETRRRKRGRTNPKADPNFWTKLGVAMLCSID